MYSVEYYNKSVVITLNNTKRLNLLNVEILKNVSLQVLKNRIEKLIIDVEQVTFIDSRAFEVLIFLSKLSGRLGVKFIFINVHNEVKELIELVDKDKKHIKVQTVEGLEELATLEYA